MSTFLSPEEEIEEQARALNGPCLQKADLSSHLRRSTGKAHWDPNHCTRFNGMPCQPTPCCDSMACQPTPCCDTMACHANPRHAATHVMPTHAIQRRMPCQPTPCCDACHANPRHAATHAMPIHAMLRHICHANPRHAATPSLCELILTTTNVRCTTYYSTTYY